MQSIVLKNCRAVVPEGILENASIVIEDGLIGEIGGRAPAGAEIIDLEDRLLLPGFIDIHNHGAVGIDVNGVERADELFEIGRFLAGRGVTTWLPTLVPDSDETYRRVIAAVGEAVRAQDNMPVARIAGVHYEGVFANTQMCGALRPEFFRTFTGGEVNELPTLADGVHLTTLAPEIAGGIELVGELRRQNWIPSIGHTRADAETLERAFAAGARHVTHLFNAMTGAHHRELGVAGWALTKDEISCEIIADGIHVHPQMLLLALHAKPADRLLLVSDSVAPTGLGDGEYELWGERITVTGGRTQNERGSIAGSVITMLDAVKTYLRLGVTPACVSRMASNNPARLIGLDRTHGTIETAKRADLVALDERGNPVLTMVGGRVV
ncbi:MAG: N-acetylglucosamine-6-phosphate deacetylase [Acidobacteria bacterium]|nr:N-acetylglucosamine-6-phosphate deacetylase [Acidobacteriota bacterium]